MDAEIINEEFSRAIAEESLIEYDPNITQDQMNDIWNICKGNPWNAVPLYMIMKIKNE